jgi:hypothetical protein
MRAPRAATTAAGALILAVPGSAIALNATQADAQSAGATPAASLSAELVRDHVAYHHDVHVRGSAPVADAGRRVALQYRAAGARLWRSEATTTIGRAGHFRFHAPVPRSGMIRVAPLPAAEPARSAAGVAAPAAVASVPSAPVHVSVGSRLRLAGKDFGGVAGQPIHVRGTLLPAMAGETVRLLGREHHRWVRLARTHTGRRGRFDIRFRVPAVSGETLRVVFAGGRFSTAAAAPAGQLAALHYSVASWYYDAGNTACGFHATYGVANKVLPCGTKVTFSHGGRTVVATVDDRGPFVAGREWDLNQNLAQALGVSGVATVLSSM